MLMHKLRLIINTAKKLIPAESSSHFDPTLKYALIKAEAVRMIPESKSSLTKRFIVFI